MGGSVQTSNNANPALNGGTKGATSSPQPAAADPSYTSSPNGKFAGQGNYPGQQIPPDVMSRYSGQTGQNPTQNAYSAALQQQAAAQAAGGNQASGLQSAMAGTGIQPSASQSDLAMAASTTPASSALNNAIASNAGALGGPANAGALAHAARTKFASGGTVSQLTGRDIDKILRAVMIAREVVKKDKE
jgi:hypothetical protein